MSEDDLDHGEMEEITPPPDIFDHSPNKHERIEMRKAVKTPSEWLRLLCRDWACNNESLLDSADAKFLDYKPYLKGMLTSQLLCRLSIPPGKETVDDGNPQDPLLDFWGILGIQDPFDKTYIVAQIDRFAGLYNIHGVEPPESTDLYDLPVVTDPTTLAANAAAAGIAVTPGGGLVALSPFNIDQGAVAAAAAAAVSTDTSKLSKKQVSEVSKAHRMAKDAEKALEIERRQNMKREQRRMSIERKEQKAREREAIAVRKAQERAARESQREERRRKKLEIRVQREKFAEEQKEAALKRAAELVSSNRVPIEITRGSVAAKAAAHQALHANGALSSFESDEDSFNRKKNRSAIVVSTASDLHRIVTHSKNLWAKYNAIAKEHNQKVNWTTVAKELGIHVKVREKYARMHARAEQRGFDWIKCGDWKIKDHPEVFVMPTREEQKAKMPPPPPDSSRTVLIDGNKEVSDEAVAAAAAVVDASVNAPPLDNAVTTEEEHVEAAAAVAASLVNDPTAGFVDETVGV